jgi:hypothetical protein
MLQHTFVHIPGVGKTTEELLWSSGARDWDEFLALESGGRLIGGRFASVARSVKQSKSALLSRDPGYFWSRLPSSEHWRLFEEFADRAAYVDIETTGLSPDSSEVTVVAIHAGGATETFVRGINLHEFPAAAASYPLVVTFNGACFDLPFLAREFGGNVGGRSTILGREIRYKAVGNWGEDYDTAEGFQEDREPRTRFAAPPDGDLQNGDLSLSAGRFDLTTSEKEEQTTGYGAFGFDFDEASNHSIDLTFFWTQKKDETVQLKDNGYFPALDYLKPGGAYDLESQGSEVTFDSAFNGTDPGGGPGNATFSTWIGNTRNSTADTPSRGPLWFSSFLESKSFKIDRDVLIPQINGDHLIEELPGLHLRWAANYAKTTQKDESLGARMWYEPCGYGDGPALVCPPGVSRVPVPTEFPATVDSLGPGKFIGNNAIFSNENDIVLDGALRSLEICKAAGVKVGYGSDLLGQLQVEQSREFMFRAEVLKPLEIIRQATTVGAEILRQEGKLGIVEPGAYADLIVVDGNPLKKLELFLDQGKHLPMIMKGGKFHKNALK